MPATLAQLQARLDSLKTALATGVTSIAHGENRVEFRSLSEMRSAISDVEQDMALLGGQQPLRSLKIISCKDL